MDITTCNRENGSQSELWNRRCWIADSLVSLIDSRIDFIREHLEAPPDADVWKLLEDLHRYCEELRVRNGLRNPAALNWDAKFPDTI